jgi:hypothetical protein
MFIQSVELLSRSVNPNCLIKNASAYNVYLNGCRDIANGNIPDMVKVNNYKVGEELIKFANNLNQYRANKENESYAYYDKYYRYMPLHTPELTKKSDDYFGKFYTNFSFEDRPKIAKKLFNKLGSLSNLITKVYSGCTLPENIDLEKAAMNIGLRATLVDSNKKLYGGLAKVTLLVKSSGDLVKLGHTIEKVDRMNKLYPYTEKINYFNEKVKLASPLEEILSCKKEASLPKDDLVSKHKEILKMALDGGIHSPSEIEKYFLEKMLHG